MKLVSTVNNEENEALLENREQTAPISMAAGEEDVKKEERKNRS